MSCPFGLENCRYPYYCNFAELENFGLSWSLPLHTDESGARVVRPSRLYLEKSIFIGIRDEKRIYACELPGGTYKEVDEGWHEGYDDFGEWEEYSVPSVRDCILKIWSELGYAPAVPSKVPFPPTEQEESDDDDDDLDEIPF